MSRSLIALASAGVILFSGSCFAQTTPAPAPAATPAPAASPAPSTTTATPASGGKRTDCRTATQGLRGPEKGDQMQLCLAQAHLDCLKQAIDQKIIGAQRKDFIKSCVN